MLSRHRAYELVICCQRMVVTASKSLLSPYESYFQGLLGFEVSEVLHHF